TIVLIIGLLIIYGVYKWGTSGSTDNQPKVASISQAEIPPAKPQPTPQQIQTQTSIIDDDGAPGLPLNYSKAVIGDIPSLPMSKNAKTGILVDLNTREVLWAKKPKVPVLIASMTKMMSILLILEDLKSNPKIGLDTMVQVTKEASHIGGSRVWLDPKEQFTIRELLKSMIVHSANDSTYLLAQYFGGGDADVFVERMNERSKELGLSATFTNTQGLPEKKASDENRASAEDMVFLAEKLLKSPIVLEDNKLKSIVFRPDSGKALNLLNTNRLIRNDFPGINGMKTGFTARAGFCITATCNRDGRVLVAVVTGFANGKERDKFVGQLLSWGYKPTKAQKTGSSTKGVPSVTSATTKKINP
ncbi:MAG: D-alanyl-D-alanine carboxypeptidase family protein, partial [Lentisphaerota bacterium]